MFASDITIIVLPDGTVERVQEGTLAYQVAMAEMERQRAQKAAQERQLQRDIKDARLRRQRKAERKAKEAMRRQA
jgi:hypothetical protein